MSEENLNDQLLKDALEKSKVYQEELAKKELAKPKYLFEQLDRSTLNRGKTRFPQGVKTRPANLPKIVDGKVVELHKEHLVLDMYGNVMKNYKGEPKTTGVPIAVKDEVSMVKNWTDKGLVTQAENFKTWEERHKFNNNYKRK